MKSSVKSGNTELAKSNAATSNPHGHWRRIVLSPLLCSVLASLGIFGGISALFVGLACVVVHSVMPGDRVFDSTGTILLIVAIPMILVGSIFLDEIDRSK